MRDGPTFEYLHCDHPPALRQYQLQLLGVRFTSPPVSLLFCRGEAAAAAAAGGGARLQAGGGDLPGQDGGAGGQPSQGEQAVTSSRLSFFHSEQSRELNWIAEPEHFTKL